MQRTPRLQAQLLRLQALSARADWDSAEELCTRIDALAAQEDRPVARVFTQWNRALRSTENGDSHAARYYRDAAAALDGAGMTGVSEAASR